MTPRVEVPAFFVGDRVREKDTLPPRRGGTGTVIAVTYCAAGTFATIRWDGDAKAVGQRPVSRLLPL